MNKYLLLLLFLITTLIIALVSFWLYESNSFRTRASQIPTFSPNNTYIFATPLTAKANDTEMIRIYCFILDDRGIGISGKKCELVSQQDLNIHTVSALSDTSGKVILDISSLAKGSFNLRFKVDNLQLTQTINITFN